LVTDLFVMNNKGNLVMKYLLCLLSALLLSACSSQPREPELPKGEIAFHSECPGVPFARYRDQTVKLTFNEILKKNAEVTAALKARTKTVETIDGSVEIGGKAGSSTDNSITGSATYKSLISADEAEVRSAYQDSICVTRDVLDNVELSEEQRAEFVESLLSTIEARKAWIANPKK
jgi:uncharacterized lipoprotein YajG